LIDLIQTIVIILILGTAIALGRLLAPYVTRVFARAPSRFDNVLNPLENWVYKLGGVNPTHSMDWKEYFLSLLFVNVIQMGLAFLIFVF